MTFKELFCVAVHNLASIVQEPLDAIGVLYDKIIDTGTVLPKYRSWSRTASVTSIHTDLESGPRRSVALGRGQVGLLD